MPLSCAAYGCTNHNQMVNKPSFFRFPNNDPELRRKWINACRRQNKDGTPWNPEGKNVYLCGAHFISGKPERSDPNHPDHVPSVFTFSKSSKSPTYKLKKYNSATKRRTAFDSSFVKPPACKKIIESEGDSPSPDLDSDDQSTMNISGVSSIVSPCTNALADNFLQPNSSLFSDMETQTNIDEPSDLLQRELASVKKENNTLRMKVDELSASQFSFRTLAQDQKKFRYYTGLNLDTFQVLLPYLIKDLHRNSMKLSYPDQILMTLIKLRLDVQFEMLSDMFNCAKSTIHDMFKRWINIFYVRLKPLIKWPDHDASLRTLPHVFRQYFPRLTSIIDCTEIFIDRPRTLKARAQVYSNYKKHSTVKFLIACTPHGSISFLSAGYGGRVSDLDITRESGFISSTYHYPGDQILADRGFTLVDDFATKCGARLIIPSFTKGKKQLSAAEVETSRQIASVRIHIERVIGLVKSRFKILEGPLPIALVKSLSEEVEGAKVANIDMLMTVCCALVNLGDGIVYSEKEK